MRVGRAEDAVVLHHALRAAGKPSPLDGAPSPSRLDGALSGPAAVMFARSALHSIA
jgi:hypothetical protein